MGTDGDSSLLLIQYPWIFHSWRRYLSPRMKLFPRLATAMKFVTPAQYSESNKAHYVINTAAVEAMLAVQPKLGSKDKVLDFGCGTGETTLSLAQGTLGGLGTPGSVLGVDISPDMVSYCNQHYNKQDNLQFQTLDVTKGEDFCQKNSGLFSMVSSFSCLHWVPDQPAAVSLFNRVLCPGGRFLFVIASTQNKQKHLLRRVYETMKDEEDWAEVLAPTRWMHFKTIHVNNEWMSTVDQEGHGSIEEEDYVRLMENHGFQVDGVKTIPLNYKITRTWIKNIFKSIMLTSFPELTGDKRKAFFTEYISRVKELNSPPEEDGLHTDAFLDGMQIFGRKVKDI